MTSLKAILAATATAVLASPVMAQSGMLSEPGPNASPPAGISRAHGSVAHGRASGLAPPAADEERRHFRLDDCVHVAFPQCGGDATQSRFDRP
jgi:hypothetical protein